VGSHGCDSFREVLEVGVLPCLLSFCAVLEGLL
jgi:hypothetical protein